MPIPSASVIVVNYDRNELLTACLRSLEAQTYADFETIVVDNGSTDSSPETLAAAEERGLRVIRNSENRGFCAANNQGLAVAKGRWIALLNNDAEAEPQWLGELLAAAEGSEGCGMAASKILSWENPSVIDKVGHLIYPDGQNRGRGTGEIDRGQYDGLQEALWPDGCAALYRREMLEQIGGFDEDFFAYADDAELGLRARIAGWSCVYAPKAVVRHHVGSTLGRYSERRLFLIERNRVWLAIKLFPAGMALQAPFYFALRAAATAWAALRGRGESARAAQTVGAFGLLKCVIRANWAALRGTPTMLRKRREIEAFRKLSPAETAALLRRYRIRLSELTSRAS